MEKKMVKVSAKNNSEESEDSRRGETGRKV